MDKPCNGHGKCEVREALCTVEYERTHFILRVLAKEMVKEHVIVIRDTLEICVTNAQLVTIMKPAFV